MQTRRFIECLTASLVALLFAASLHAQRPSRAGVSIDRAFLACQEDLAYAALPVKGAGVAVASLMAGHTVMGTALAALPQGNPAEEGGGISTGASPVRRDRVWRTAFRTNVLVPALNVGFEVGLGRNRRFVLGTEFWYPWLRPFIKDAGTCLEGLGWSVDGTFYFKRSADPKKWATGPYLGLSGAAGYYDVCFNSNGRQGEGLAAALYFGWAWPVNRGRWRLSLDIGGGYMVTRFREYHVWEDGAPYRPGDWQNVLRWWGPTRASLSLHIPVWYDAGR